MGYDRYATSGFVGQWIISFSFETCWYRTFGIASTFSFVRCGVICITGFNDGKIYDMLGKEVFDIRKGVIYIRNNKKFILVK